MPLLAAGWLALLLQLGINNKGTKNMSHILSRIDRLESLDEIRQLPAKYSLALDMRDIDALVNLFPEDVRVGKGMQGRAHFKRWMDETLRTQFTGTSHHIGNHIIEFNDPDHAIGVVYSKNEHETTRADGGIDWVIMQMIYWDQYERIDGRWYFQRRLPCYWYATDLNNPPVGEHKMRWPFGITRLPKSCQRSQRLHPLSSF
jgi:ketosteroid isomerase-like protein